MEKEIPYFSEETMKHLILKNATHDRWLFRSLKAMIACKLTLVYGPYHMMSDLQSLAASGYQETYEHAEILASFLSQLVPSSPTTPSELMQTTDDYSNEAIDKYKEYKHLLELLEGDCFYPKVAEKFCKKVYKARNYTIGVRPQLYYFTPLHQQPPIQRRRFFPLKQQTECIRVIIP